VTTADLPTPGRVLAIGAHPDDAEFGCGGTLAKWSARGAHVELLVLTDGSKGSWDAGADRDVLFATRKKEQDAAAALLGIAAVHWLGLVDGELRDDAAARRLLCQTIRSSRPDVVLGHDPWRQYRLHPDHRHAGWLTLDAVVAARDPHFFPDAGPPHRPSDLLLYEAQIEDHHEVIDGHLETKVRALLCHRSQWRSTMGIEVGTALADEQRGAFERRIHDEARTAGAAAGDVPAEAFKLVHDV
jgi:LmbE family N-acetylglucosaminyl deacetylase